MKLSSGPSLHHFVSSLLKDYQALTESFLVGNFKRACLILPYFEDFTPEQYLCTLYLDFRNPSSKALQRTKLYLSPKLIRAPTSLNLVRLAFNSRIQERYNGKRLSRPVEQHQDQVYRSNLDCPNHGIADHFLVTVN